MDLTEMIANAALIIPGLLTEKLIAALSIRRERSELEGIVLAVVYSFIVVMLALGLQNALVPLLELMGIHCMERAALRIMPMNISLAPPVVLISSLLTAFVSILYINRDGHAFFRHLGLTKRHTYTDIWSRQFWNADGGRLRLQLRDGRCVEGRLGLFDDFAEGHVQLLAPRIRSLSGSWEEFPGGEMLVDRADIGDIVFLAVEGEAAG